jgi:hypothetical protein
VQIVAVIDHAGHLCGKADRCTFQEAPGKADRPSVDGLLRLCFRGLLWFCWRLEPLRGSVLVAHIFRLRVHQGRLNGQEQRTPCSEKKQRARSDQSVHRSTHHSSLAESAAFFALPRVAIWAKDAYCTFLKRKGTLACITNLDFCSAFSP